MKTTLITIAAAILMASAAKAQNLSNTSWTSLHNELYFESDDGKNYIKGFYVDCYTDGGGLRVAKFKMKRVSQNVFAGVDDDDDVGTLFQEPSPPDAQRNLRPPRLQVRLRRPRRIFRQNIVVLPRLRQFKGETLRPRTTQRQHN